MYKTNKTIPHRTFCVDLEFSYGRKKNNSADLYEIGVVVLNELGQEIDEFQTYVTPSHFCSETMNFLGLTYSDFDNAPSLHVAMLRLNEFVEHHSNQVNGEISWCSWGDRDKKLLSQKAGQVSLAGGHHLTRSPYFDAQDSYQRQFSYHSRKIALQDALYRTCGDYGLNHHSALDDARSLSRVVAYHH